MHILFAISAICFVALVLTVVAIARHVHSRRASTHPQQDFAQHLFAAAEVQNSRVPHTLAHQTVRDIRAKKDWGQSSDRFTAGPNTHEPQFTSLKRF